MCGIVGYIGGENPKSILLDGLRRLEYRGYDSAGIAVFDKGETKVFRSEGRLINLEKKLDGVVFDAGVGIGHTRWATHGAPNEINAHPHRVGTITVVHNGIIENYSEHQATIRSAGFDIVSDTDTEIFAHLLSMEVSRGCSVEEGLAKVLPTLKGSYAFVFINEAEPDKIYGVCNGAPLLLGLGDGECYLASDVQAVLPYTNKVVYLNDGQMAVCQRNKFEIRDSTGAILTPEVKEIHWTADQLDKSGYTHYMLKEIFEQGQSIANTIDGNVDHSNGMISLAGIEEVLGSIKECDRVMIAACGTARHAGMVGKSLIESIAEVPVDIDFASEYRYRKSILSGNVLGIFVSQSGETADTLAALKEAKKRSVKTLAICNVRESSLTRHADATAYTNAGPEIGVASTKAFTTQLVVTYMLAVQMGTARGRLSDKQAKQYAKDLLRLPLFVETALKTEQKIKDYIPALETSAFYFYMGRGTYYPLALEGALKLKEISYLHAEGYAAGELKHGPIALIDKNTVAVVLAPNRGHETLYEKTLANLQEVKSRGAQIISFGTEGDQQLESQSDLFIGLPHLSPELDPVLFSVPIQLLAYYVALARGTDIDKPRNLAKSVTVE